MTHEIDIAACRRRQRRLLDYMHEHDVELAIVNQRESVQWLTGLYHRWFFHPTAALSADGRLTLVVPNRAPEAAAADEVATYEAQWHSTLRNDQPAASSAALLAAIGSTPRRVGVEFSSFGQHLAGQLDADFVDIEPELYRLRRCKDADELALIRQAIAGTQRMYERAREIIKPGISELEVFNELQAAAVTECGEMLTCQGNDYQCGTPGGLPRNDRLAEAGELYILDLGHAFRGYFADNCRTIAVSDVSDAQQEAWTFVMRVFDHVENVVRPGKSARELFEEAAAILGEAPHGEFFHHLGHGIGLFPHEAPHLNPNWDDTFEEGEVFTVEPGLYCDELRGGMRIENNYVVTATGIDLLTPFPRELSTDA